MSKILIKVREIKSSTYLFSLLTSELGIFHLPLLSLFLSTFVVTDWGHYKLCYIGDEP